MREEDYQISFEIIATAGDSKGYSMDAICDARKGDFESANEKLKEANQRLLQAHELQTDMIAKEAGGEQVPVNIILIHSQDQTYAGGSRVPLKIICIHPHPILQWRM